jgi:alpha-beta hydrolase superfamily lysophospholipase
MLMIMGCTRIFFFPSPERVITPKDIGLSYTQHEIRSSDGTSLITWFLPAQNETRGVILYLHGNAQNISYHLSQVAWLPEQGFSVLLLDYRGYGGSEGSPSVPGALQDITAALDLLVSLNTTNKPVWILGQSLGGALATAALASSPLKNQIQGLILDSAPSDYRFIVRDTLQRSFFTYLFAYPLSYFVDNEAAPRSLIAQIAPVSVLIIHGTEDTIVSPYHAEVLYNAALEPKQRWNISGAAHIEGLQRNEVRKALCNYLTTVQTPTETTTTP